MPIPYDPIRHGALAETLYRAALPDWPLEPGRLADLLARCHPVLVTEAGDGLIAGYRQNRVGRVVLLMVHPERHRRGIGRRLVGALLPLLDVERVHLGAGPVRLWPGLPEDLDVAGHFFPALGWRTTGAVADLTLDLGGWAATEQPSVSTPSDLHAVLAFEKRHFPAWLGEFRSARREDVLVAGEGGVAGALLIGQPVPWPRLLPGASALACVGVDPEHRGLGIGQALVRAATAEMKRRGWRTGFVGWTDRPGFYEQVGYGTWRRYLSAVLVP